MKKWLLIIIAGVGVALGVFYLVKSGALATLAVPRSVSVTVPTSRSSSTSSVQVTKVDESTLIQSVKLFIYSVSSFAKKFIELVADIVKGGSTTETLINGGILTAVFIALGYLAMVLAKFIRFLFYAAAAFTVGITIMCFLGMI